MTHAEFIAACKATARQNGVNVDAWPWFSRWGLLVGAHIGFFIGALGRLLGFGRTR